MTREEAIEVISQDIPCEHDTDLIEALNMSLEALKQEPCEDAISRKEVAEILNHQRFGIAQISWDIISEKIKALPSVTPTREHGEWERGYSYPDGQYVKCSVCSEIIKCTYPMHFCPNCGADMRGEQKHGWYRIGN